MDNITLDEIIEVACLESAKMQHFFVGVEHLFIALTKLEGGLTPMLLEQADHEAPYLRYATRQIAGRGDDRRYWSGYRYTPRATTVLQHAREILEDGIQPPERALLMAILEEADSVATRAMVEAGVNIANLLDMLQDWEGVTRAQPPAAKIFGGDTLSGDRQAILRQMFRKYDTVKIEHIFTEGFSGSTVMLVRPVHGDGRADAPVVVKIDDRHSIQWEKKRYDTFVKDTLPPRTARVEGEPVLPDRLSIGGIKYTFLQARSEVVPVNLHDYLATHQPGQIADFLRSGLYQSFRENWWGQRQPYSFATWQEYELVLPPALIVDALAEHTLPPTGMHLRPLGEWSHDNSVHTGDIVELDDFTALKTKRDKGVVQIISGAESAAINWTGRVDVYGLDLTQKVYFRGEPIRKVIGRVRQTRTDVLLEQAHQLGLDFTLSDEFLPRLSNFSDRLPNPVHRYVKLLERKMSATLSTIHGDLHTGNILIGSNNDAWLIDFEWTRDGHTLFDWAVLEVSLLIEYVAARIGVSWDEVRQAVMLLDRLNRDGQIRDQSPLGLSMLPVVELREIVRELLYADPATGIPNWTEYHVALALCALRVLGWGNRPLTARRLAFMVSALSMSYVLNTDNTRSHTAADLTTDQGTFGGSMMG